MTDVQRVALIAFLDELYRHVNGIACCIKRFSDALKAKGE